MLMHRLSVALAVFCAFNAHADEFCQTPRAEYSALDIVCPFSQGLAAIRIGYAWGYVDRNGALVVPPIFDDARDFSGGFAAVSQNEKWGFINPKGEWVIPAQYSHVSGFSDGLAAVTIDGRSAYLDSAGQVVIQPRFRSAGTFIDGVAVVQEEDNAVALIDKTGKVIHQFPPDISIDDWQRPGGNFIATRKFRPELMDLQGQRRQAPLAAGDYFGVLDDVYLVSRSDDQGERFGIMDQAGNWLLTPVFSKFNGVHDGLALVGDDKKLGAIDKTGKFVIPPIHQSLTYEQKGLYFGQVTDADERRIYDKHGKLLLSELQADKYPQQEGEWTILSKKGGGSWAIHQDGAVHSLDMDYGQIKHHGRFLLIIANNEDDAEKRKEFVYLSPERILYSSKQAAAKENYDNLSLIEGDSSMPLGLLAIGYDQVAVLTADGKLVSNPEWQYESNLLDYQYARDGKAFEGPMVIRSKEGGWGAIDAHGQWLVRPEYDQLSMFRDGIALAIKEHSWWVIDRRGHKSLLPEDQRFQLLGAGLIAAGYGEEAQVLRFANGVLEPIAIEKGVALGEHFVGGLIPAQKAEHWGLMNPDLQWVFEPRAVYAPSPVWWKHQLFGWMVERNDENNNGDRQSSKGFVTPEGRQTIPARYRDINLNETLGLLRVDYDSIYRGLLRPDGSALVPPEYDSIDIEQNPLILRRHEVKGLVNQSGAWVIEPGAYYFSDSQGKSAFYLEKVDGEEVFLDPSGLVSRREKPAALPKDSADQWRFKVADEYGDDEHTVFYGFDWQPRLKVPGKVSEPFSEGWTVSTRHSGKQGIFLVNSSGKQVGPLPYDSIGSMSEGLALAGKIPQRKPGKGQAFQSRPARYGFIDMRGRSVIPTQFEEATPFADGRSIVVHKGNLGIIDQQGKLLLHSAWRCGREPALLDRRGRVIWPEGKPDC